MAFEDIPDEINDLTAARQRTLFNDAMDREDDRDARHDARPDPDRQDEHCLMHQPSCVRGRDGRWHRPEETR